MSMTLLLLLLIIVALAALGMVSIANHYQRRARMIQHQVKRIKRLAEELEEVALAVDSLVESRAIPATVNDEAIALLQRALRIDPKANFLETALSNAEQRTEMFTGESPGRRINRLMDSDARIARAQRMINEAAKVVRRRKAQGKLSERELDAYIQELAWAHLQVDVISHIAQGHKAMNRGDHLNATAFYRKAQQLLMQSHHRDERRQQQIKELSELINGRRTQLSPDLMPELAALAEADNDPDAEPVTGESLNAALKDAGLDPGIASPG